MGQRKLEQVLNYDYLGEGVDPTYDIGSQDLWYLGLAGELAAEIKCSKITLPMLSKEKYNWQDELNKALEEAISLRPQRHVNSFGEAISDFSKRTEPHPNYAAIWFSNQETRNKLMEAGAKEGLAKFTGPYKDYHYELDRCGLTLDLPPKIIALVPEPEYFGVLSINEQYFNFFFFPHQIEVYFVRNYQIAPDA